LDRRLNVILGLDAKLALERMAKHEGVTRKRLLERVLLDTQSRRLEPIDGEQLTRFYDDKTSTTSPTN
jgi:hypothetical protein